MDMSRGKYQKSRKGKMKPVVLILSLVLLLVAVGGTAAYLWTASKKVTNTFTPAEVEISVDEKKTDTTKENITFTNEGSVPVYIRATLVTYWTDTFDATDDGVHNPTDNIIPQPSGAEVTGGETLNNGWFKIGNIYYYAIPVEPKTGTAVLLSPITVKLPDGATAQYHVDIRAEAIQAEPESVVTQAWKDVQVENGRLKAK